MANIVQNALQYTSSGGQVSVKAYQNASIQIKIEDTGIGIAPEHLDKIFERFWQANPSRSYSAGGAGLGLAIAQAIIHQHSGAIAVTSQLGIGTCFTVRLSRS
ncbi:MAG: sensor histidine kinase [Cyanophyceae cyanobacterium]